MIILVLAGVFLTAFWLAVKFKFRWLHQRQKKKRKILLFESSEKKNHNFKQIIFNSTEKSHSCDKNNYNLDPIATKYLWLFEQNGRNNLASTHQCDPARKYSHSRTEGVLTVSIVSPRVVLAVLLVKEVSCYWQENMFTFIPVSVLTFLQFSNVATSQLSSLTFH